ncbi:MAG: MATE family efflux transporter [Ruminococcaceae bacterium]|nr:MATE family efflux transporter [Oscillospiraceae bacterium]
MLRKFIGDKAFYKNVMALTIPIMLQTGITNFVNMLDNIMIGKVGTVEMIGVAVSNQLFFVFNLCIFGALAGAGIFGAQFFGNNDHKGVQDTFRFRLIFCLLLTLAGMALFWFKGDFLISLYLKGEGNPADAAASLGFAKNYLRIMLIGLIPYTLAQCYSSTLREVGKSMPPMVAGTIAVGVNLLLNYILIFGKFGAPALGTNGAAIATVISRFVELAVVAVWTHLHKSQAKFIIGVYRSMRVPFKLTKQILAKGLPLMMNEALWSLSVVVLNQCYSLRGLDVVAANNISQTFWNVFSASFISIGTAIGIILGQILGSGDMEKARDSSRKLIAFSIFVSVTMGILYIIFSLFIPHLYNTTEAVRILATRLMIISAFAMPLVSFINAAYFTLRSGGKTLITIIFDCGLAWILIVPVGIILSNFTNISILPLYAICQALDFVKCVLGFIFVKRGTWIQNIVANS